MRVKRRTEEERKEKVQMDSPPAPLFLHPSVSVVPKLYHKFIISKKII